LHEETKGSVYINQYFNQLNIDAHYKSTGPEIWKQTNGNITHLVACSGTVQTAKFLKNKIRISRFLGLMLWLGIENTMKQENSIMMKFILTESKV
jgi:cystathionine beta-synthase